MEIKIKRVWSGKLDKYKNILDKYNPIYKGDEYDYFALVEIKDIKELFTLSKELNIDLIISHHNENTIDIYDDYVE
jgi:hypothetical protein